MADKKLTAREAAAIDFMWYPSGDGGGWTLDDLKTLAPFAVFHELRDTNVLLRQIRDLLLNLGADGLHEVILHHRGVARRAKTKAAAQRRAARKAKATGKDA